MLGEHDTQLRHVKYLLEELLTRIPPPVALKTPQPAPVDPSPPPAAAAHALTALKWALAVWKQQGASTVFLEGFLDHFCQVFDQCAMAFRIFAEGSGWNESALSTTYRRRLNSTLQSELACRDENLGLEQLIQLSIRLDNIIRAW